MKHIVAVLPLYVLFVAAPAGAQVPAPAPPKSKPAPRAPDGKPDLSGFWQGPLLRNFFESVGGPPFTPEGQKAYQYNLTQSVNPEGLCLFAGIPRASISGVPFEIVQNSNRVAFLYELMSTWRSIPVDGRTHPKRIEPVVFRQRHRQLGRRHAGDRFHRIQGPAELDRRRRASAQRRRCTWWSAGSAWTQDHLDHDVWVEDPKFYTKPWTFHRVFTHMPAGQEVMEFACDENNLDREAGRLGFGPQQPGK